MKFFPGKIYLVLSISILAFLTSLQSIYFMRAKFREKKVGDVSI